MIKPKEKGIEERKEYKDERSCQWVELITLKDLLD